MGFGILQPIGLFALLLLIPFIIIYLRKPKAINRILPSIMFLSEHKGMMRRSSILQKLLRNLLFLIQLLLLTMLLIALAEPYYETAATRLFEDTIIIMDTSASMSHSAQFQRAQEEALRSIGRTTTIIASGSPARIILDSGRPDQANARIRSMTPETVPSDLESALILASSQADNKGAGTRIIIITDKRGYAAQSYLSLLVQKGMPVTIIDVKEDIEGNIGIVDAHMTPNNVIFTIRNSYPTEKQVSIRSDYEEVQTNIGPMGFGTVNMRLGQGENTFVMDDPQGFQYDNNIKIMNSARQELDILIVTTSESKTASHRAMLSINTTQMNIEQNTLGTINKDYDIIIMSNYAPEIILPSFAPNVLEMVSRGSMLIITRSRNMASLSQDIMPVTFEGTVPDTVDVRAQPSPINHGVEYSVIRAPPRAIPKNGTTVLASTDDGNVIAAAMTHGSGLIVYLAYDDTSDIFSTTPSYPILYSNLVDIVTRAGLISQQNIMTGSYYALASAQPVQKPSEQYPTIRESIHISETGIYRIGSSRIAAQLLSSEESDPSTKLRYDIRGVDDGTLQKTTINVMLATLIGILALLLLFAEALYIKKRGDV
ncbi:MAG: BatA domain-containing protein [Candidatus Woesearchaeota archaeon]